MSLNEYYKQIYRQFPDANIAFKQHYQYLDGAAHWLADQLSQDRDVMIAIDGYERTGKSTLAYHLAHKIAEYAGSQFNVDNYVWDGQLLVKKIQRLPNKSVCIYDEAGLDMYARRSTSNVNVNINRALMVLGYKNQCIICCMPDIQDIDKMARDRRFQIWFRTLYDWRGSDYIRGAALVSSHLYQELYNDIFWPAEFEVKFDDMPPAFKVRYKEAKERYTVERVNSMVGDDEAEEKRRDDLIKDRVAHAIKVRDKYAKEKNKHLTDGLLSKILGVSPRYFRDIKANLKKSESI